MCLLLYYKQNISVSNLSFTMFLSYFVFFSCVISCSFAGKKVTVRPPAPALVNLTKPKHSSRSLLSNIKRGLSVPKVKKGACASNRKSVGDVQERPLRERLTHLLALRPYKRPDLMLRLQKDGLSEEGKDMLDAILMEVIFLLFYMYGRGKIFE